jgi:hypothetical protein
MAKLSTKVQNRSQKTENQKYYLKMGKINVTPEEQLRDHVLFREWFDNLPYAHATRTRKALQEFCGVGPRTVAYWLDGSKPIRKGYKRMINIFTNQNIFAL